MLNVSVGSILDLEILQGGVKCKTLNPLGSSPCEEKKRERGWKSCYDYCQGDCWRQAEIDYDEWELEESQRVEFEIEFDLIKEAIRNVLAENGLTGMRLGINGTLVSDGLKSLELWYNNRFCKGKVLPNGKIRILTWM